MSPATILGANVAQSIEDDVSLIWLTDQTQTDNSVRTLSMSPSAALAGIGEIFSEAAVTLMFADPTTDDRAPDIVVTPNIGVIYTGGTKKVAEHGGFAHDDTHVMLLVSNPNFSPSSVSGAVETRQIAPTILAALGLNPQSLQAVVLENTQKLPGLPF
jgi:hypothetical protein